MPLLLAILNVTGDSEVVPKDNGSYSSRVTFMVGNAAIDAARNLKALFIKAVDLEYRYAEDTMPRGVLGLNANMFKGYLRYIANRRATQIGLEPLFPNEENPFPWMSEMIDLKKERNFFETRVIEYQSGGALSWD